MIRRPPKRFGGALQEEFDKLWDAMQRVQISSATGLEMDQTTNGTMIRVQPRAAAAPVVPGAFFKITSVGLGAAFNAIEADSAGNASSFIMTGLWGSGRMMESPTTRLPPLGLSYDATYGTDEHELVWDFATAGATGYTEAIPNTGDVVFAVRSALEKNFTGHDASGSPNVANKIYWYVLTPAVPVPPPPPGGVPRLDNPTVSHGLFGDPVEEGTVVTWSAQGREDFNPAPITIEWTRDVGFGPEVMFSSSLTNGMGTFMLTVTLADSGTYSVVATNSSGSSDVQTFPLNVVPAQ